MRRIHHHKTGVNASYYCQWADDSSRLTTKQWIPLSTGWSGVHFLPCHILAACDSISLRVYDPNRTGEWNWFRGHRPKDKNTRQNSFKAQSSTILSYHYLVLNRGNAIHTARRWLSSECCCSVTGMQVRDKRIITFNNLVEVHAQHSIFLKHTHTQHVGIMKQWWAHSQAKWVVVVRPPILPAIFPHPFEQRCKISTSSFQSVFSVPKCKAHVKAALL